jgi:ABC-type Fe3+/spermidine/putrescine transport system ATPase subunit
MLEIIGLRKAWPGFRLEASLSLEDGAIGAILGPSGCGKSTLLRLAAGLLESEGGRIAIDGRNLAALPPERRGIGMVFQDYALFPRMSVRRNIEYGPRMEGRRRSEREAIASSLAASFGIEPLLERNPSSLSGGEQQRVALARSLAARPRLVLLDEPLSSLDAGLRRKLRSEIAERLRAAGVMALHVTHDVEEALAIADRVFLMGRGSIIEEGVPEELYARPRTAYGARFLGRGPVLPLSGLERAGEGLRALTALGAFRCSGTEVNAMRAIASGGAGFSLFFPAEAAVLRPAPTSSAGVKAREDNLVEGVALESVFAGRFRRIRLSCSTGSTPELLEIEAPPDARPARGRSLSFAVRPEDCMILPEGE